MKQSQFYGVAGEQYDNRDYLISDIIIPRTPKGTDSFRKNGSIQYDQREVAKNSCTIHGAMTAYSALTGYRFTLEERKKIWEMALKEGANPEVGWYINSAVDLVRRYVNENLPIKVEYRRMPIDSFEFGAVMRLGYTPIIGYCGNKDYQLDRDDNGIINNVKFPNYTYAHCLSTTYSIGDEYDLVVDNYPTRKTNLYKIPSANWKQLVMWRVFFGNAYIYLIK
jgi:hypothetical protein